MWDTHFSLARGLVAEKSHPISHPSQHEPEGNLPLVPTVLDAKDFQCPEHEVWLSFNGDLEAEMFRDYITQTRLAAFRAWAQKHEKDYL